MNRYIVILFLGFMLISCRNDEVYIFNQYGDEINISKHLKTGEFNLINNTEKVKFINTKAKLTSVELNKIYRLTNMDSIQSTKYIINYSYSYYLDQDIVDVYIVDGGIKYFVRKYQNELIVPFETDELLWGK